MGLFTVFVKQCEALLANEKVLDEMLVAENKALVQLKADKALFKEDLVEAIVEEREANIWEFMGDDSEENLEHEKFKAEAQRIHLRNVQQKLILLQDVKKKIKISEKLEMSKLKI